MSIFIENLKKLGKKTILYSSTCSALQINPGQLVLVNQHAVVKVNKGSHIRKEEGFPEPSEYERHIGKSTSGVMVYGKMNPHFNTGMTESRLATRNVADYIITLVTEGNA